MHFPTIETAFITQKFGVNKQAYARFGLLGHNGIDFGAPIESDIFACDDGVVVLAEERKYGYGRHIRIQHNGYLSIYGHLQFMVYGVGEHVNAGDIIGGMGGDPRDGVPYDGNSTGTHLHFEIRPDGEPANNGFAGAVDPIAYLVQRIPYRYKGTVTAQNGLNIRTEPNAKATKIGIFRNGTEFKAIEKHVVAPDQVWLKLRSLRDEWIAAKYGNLYANWEMVNNEPEPDPIPDINANDDAAWNNALGAAQAEVNTIFEELKR